MHSPTNNVLLNSLESDPPSMERLHRAKSSAVRGSPRACTSSCCGQGRRGAGSRVTFKLRLFLASNNKALIKNFLSLSLLMLYIQPAYTHTFAVHPVLVDVLVLLPPYDCVAGPLSPYNGSRVNHGRFLIPAMCSSSPAFP